MRITWIISPDVSDGDWNMTDRKQQKIRNGGNTAWMKKQNRKQNRCAGWNPCHGHRDGSVVSFLAADMADTVSSDSNRVHKIYWNHRDQPCRMGQVWIYFVDMMILLSAFCNFILMQDLLFWERTGRIRRHFTERGQQEYCLLTILCWRSICFLYFTGT